MCYERHKGSRLDAIRFAQRIHDVVGLKLVVIEREKVAMTGFVHFIAYANDALEQESDRVIYRTRDGAVVPAVVKAVEKVRAKTKYFRLKERRSHDQPGV